MDVCWENINKICKIHHRTLQVVYNEYNKSYEELLQLNNNVFIHQRHLHYLVLEVFKSLMHLNPEFKWSYFSKRPIPYDLRKGTTVFLPFLNHFVLALILYISEDVSYGIIFFHQSKIVKLLMNSK